LTKSQDDTILEEWTEEQRVGGKAPLEFRKFEKLVRSYNCRTNKTTREWEVADCTDGKWVCSFATVSGRAVKRFYVDQFERLVRQKRAQAKAD
jgi:hypothetical protein